MRTMTFHATFATLSCLALAGNGFADSGIRANPGIYDPGNTRTVAANWVTDQGLPDAGNSDHALILVKATATTTNAAAGADIEGVEGEPADGVYGFDIRADSYGSAGSPRFDLTASDGFHFVGGAANGTVTGTFTDARGNVWRRIEFNPTTQAFPPVKAGATIESLSLIVDEDTEGSDTGSSIVDNINVNDTYIGKPGDAN